MNQKSEVNVLTYVVGNFSPHVRYLNRKSTVSGFIVGQNQGPVHTNSGAVTNHGHWIPNTFNLFPICSRVPNFSPVG
jgi:hypothetical protein